MRAELKANDEFRDNLLHQYPWNRTPLPALSHLPVYPEVSSPTLDTIQDYLAAHSHEVGQHPVVVSGVPRKSGKQKG